MAPYDDDSIIYPESRIIEFKCQDKDGKDITCKGRIDYPVGMMHDTVVQGVSGVQLPFRYQIWRERAKLNTCCWWVTSGTEITDANKLQLNRAIGGTIPEIFSFSPVNVSGNTFQVKVKNETLNKIQTINNPDTNVVGGWSHEIKPSFALEPTKLNTKLINGATSVPTRCSLTKATLWNQGKDGTPPCNGAKTQCPYYTGPEYDYIEDEQLAPGQPVIGQMVQEIRTYMKNWKGFNSPQEEWEDTYTIPYIWAGDKDDPHALDQQTDFTINNLEPVMSLVKVYWDPINQEAILSKVPSEPVSTENKSTDNLTPPDFPTLVPNLGESIPFLKVTYPPSSYSSNKPSQSKTFVYKSFYNKSHKIYLAGISLYNTLVCFVNKSINISFIDVFSDNIKDTDIDDAIETLIKKYNNETVEGFNFTYAKGSRFWELRQGLDIQQGLNEIIILAKNDNKWEKIILKVEYTFYHVDVFQEGYSSNLSVPQTTTLLSSLSNINVDEDLTFTMLSLTNKELSISNTYHTYILDRSYSRLISNDDFGNPKDERFWGLFQTKQTLRGAEDTGSFTWSKFDNCNRYLLEFKNGTPAVAPAGLKYGWVIKDIVFTIKLKKNKVLVVDMEMDNDSESIVRSTTGELIAHNFIIIKPKNDINFKTPNKESYISLTYYEFSAQSNIEQDDLSIILEEHGSEIIDNDSLKEGYGGEELTQLSVDSNLKLSPHTYTVDTRSNQIIFKDYAKYDLSYNVEFVIPNFNNNKPIGRKWFVGVLEKNINWLTDIEIRYAWSADYDQRPFQPFLYKGGPANDPSNPLEYFTKGLTTYYPNCGDHEINPVGFGSLWFPYDACDAPRVVINDQAIQVDYLIPGVSPVDEKYRGPDFKVPLVLKFNALGFFNACVWEYSLGTKYHSPCFFVGYSRLRGPISTIFDPILYARYLAEDWTFPQLGNRGRNASRVFRTMHFKEYLFITSAGPRVGLGWLPTSPHESSLSVFDNRPRTIFENQVQDINNLKSLVIDYKSISNQKYLKSLSITEESDLISSDFFLESLQLKRATWEQVYQVNIIRSVDGKGTRFPTKGFYFNFKNPSVVWAFRENNIEPARTKVNIDDNLLITNKLTGITIEKYKSSQHSGINLDKFNRPVYTGLNEKDYTVNLKNIEYNTSTGQIEEYAKIYINPELPVYFNHLTGQILNVPNNTSRSTEIQPYAYTNPSGLDFTLQSYFTPTVLENNAIVPEFPEDLEEFNQYGNLFSDKEITYYYINSIDSQGPIDREEEAFSSVGFIRSLNISNIIPTFLPKVKTCLKSEDFPTLLNPTIKYNRYYGQNLTTISGKSNTDLPLTTEKVFQCVDTYKGSQAPVLGKWYGGANPNNSPYSGPIVIEIKLKYPLELNQFKFSYGLQVNAELKTKIKKDPSIKVTVIDSLTNSFKTLFSKLEIDLSVGKSTDSFYKDVDINLSQYQGLFINKIIVEIGQRDSVSDFSISKFLLKYLKIRNVEEKITVLEPKYLVTTGYSNGDENIKDYLPSQSEKYITGTISTYDISDNFEYSGICEFWQPGLVGLNETDDIVSRGKISRNYASPFKSFDANKFYYNKEIINTPDVFFTGTLEQMENKQLELYEEFIEKLKDQTNLLDLTLKYYLNPYDIYLLVNKLNSNIIEKNARYLISTSKDIIGKVSQGTKTTQWQFEGYEACPAKKLVPRVCAWSGPGTGYGISGDRRIVAYVSINESPDICNSRGSLSTIGLLTILQSPPANNIAGGSVVGALVTGEQAMNNLSELQFEQAQALSTEVKIEKYKKELEEKYKQEYNQ